MQILSLVSIASFGAGAVAAWTWYKSSKVGIDPSWQTEPGDAQLSQMGWMAGTMEAINEVGRLNKIASIWTGISVLLSGVASVAAN